MTYFIVFLVCCLAWVSALYAWPILYGMAIQVWNREVEHRRNPPKCIDCLFFEPYHSRPKNWKLGKCLHSKGIYGYAENEREQAYSKCGKYGKLFQERV